MGWQVELLITPRTELWVPVSMNGPQQKDVATQHAAKLSFFSLRILKKWSVSVQAQFRWKPWTFLAKNETEAGYGQSERRLGEEEAWSKHHHLAYNWPQLGKNAMRENKSSQTYSYRGSWWHSNSREASAETEPLLQCRDHGIKRNTGGGMVTLKVIWRRGLSSLLTHLKNFMASRIRQEKEITSFDLLCDI